MRKFLLSFPWSTLQGLGVFKIAFLKFNLKKNFFTRVWRGKTWKNYLALVSLVQISSPLLVKWGPLYTVHVLVSSQTVTQAGQSVACLKCLVDVKQLICSFFLTDFFEISQFIHRYCFLYFLKTPYLNSCEKSNLAGVLLRSARLPAFLGCLLPCCLWAASWPVAPPRTGAQDTFVTSGFQLLRAESE